MDVDASVYNGTDVARGVRVTGRFRHTNQADPWNPKEEELPAQVIGEGESASYTTNDWGAGFFDFPTKLERDEEPWSCDAYLRIEAFAEGKKDDWFAGDPNTFDWRDRR